MKKRTKPDITKVKVIVFNIVNVFLIGATLYILSRMPIEATEIKNLRSQEIAEKQNGGIAILKAEIEKSKEQVSEIEKVFLDDEGFLVLISEMDRLTADGTIKNYNFPVSKPVTDKNKNFGLPISIVIEGSLNQVNNSYQNLLNLPFILKAVNVNLDILSSELGEDVIQLRFGGIIYTDESYNKN